jgi:hypothetical protein
MSLAPPWFPLVATRVRHNDFRFVSGLAGTAGMVLKPLIAPLLQSHCRAVAFFGNDLNAGLSHAERASQCAFLTVR